MIIQFLIDILIILSSISAIVLILLLWIFGLLITAKAIQDIRNPPDKNQTTDSDYYNFQDNE